MVILESISAKKTKKEQYWQRLAGKEEEVDLDKGVMKVSPKRWNISWNLHGEKDPEMKVREKKEDLKEKSKQVTKGLRQEGAWFI